MERSPLLSPQDTDALKKSSIDREIRDDIEALDNDQGWPSQDSGSCASAGPPAPLFNLRSTIPLLLTGIIIFPCLDSGSQLSDANCRTYWD